MAESNRSDSATPNAQASQDQPNAVAPPSDDMPQGFSFESHDYVEAFEARREDIDAVPDERANVINTDIGLVVQTVFGFISRISPLLSEMAKAVPNYDMSIFARLHSASLALNYLHAKIRILLNTTDTELVLWLTERRKAFHADAQPLAVRNIINPDQLSELKHTNNHHALAYDVMGLSELILSKYDDPRVRLMCTKEELIEAREKANELFTQLGTRQFGPNAKDEIKVLRRKAFALVTQLWDDIDAFVRFARRSHGDADRLIPSLYPKRTGKKPIASAQDVDDGDVAETAPNGNASNGDSKGNGTARATAEADAAFDVEQLNRNVAQAATAAVAEPVAPAARPGFPGGSPFRANESR